MRKLDTFTHVVDGGRTRISCGENRVTRNTLASDTIKMRYELAVSFRDSNTKLSDNARDAFGREIILRRSSTGIITIFRYTCLRGLNGIRNAYYIRVFDVLTETFWSSTVLPFGTRLNFECDSSRKTFFQIEGEKNCCFIFFNVIDSVDRLDYGLLVINDWKPFLGSRRVTTVKNVRSERVN